jgi:hypothetical protein
MKVKLNFGLMDLEDVVKECDGYLKTANVSYTAEEDEYGNVHVILTSPWRFEIKKCVERYLGNFRGMADSIIDDNIVQP